ncbi:MAG TPA: HAMP domain-containing sensor histidine kinase [Baekduia sp.]|uniref:sensor histidine kinase n=1 Tax=Baekduia sp. TaxID=2600305 RepID=UPI002D767BC1|nr:HAMP domain-containing sensor histidine kinase [Baekduia sp.]HET6506138.1 HAMP domain-containing sensor histidine kinase [Baekduia sp.]
MTLRTRLVALLIVLAASGMLLLGGVTYMSQRSFQNARVDDQARSAEPAIARALDTELGITGRSYGGGGGGGGGLRPENANLPSGTYGQRRSASGAVLATTTISYGDQALPAPALPARLADGSLSTVKAVSGSLRYRVSADVQPDGSTTIVAVPLAGVDAALHRLLLVEAAVIGGVLLVLLVLAGVLVRIELRPLRRIAQTADAIAAGELSRRVETTDPRTEVGRLGDALNGMLGRLEHAFDEREASEARLRAFLSDASHELRTPLASIRGYSELYRIGAAREPAEVERAMDRIEAESARMGGLVDDLLTLARVDEVREPAREPLDLRELLEDARDDARAAAPERRITLNPTGPVAIEADGDALRRVFANLLRNAMVHTPAGTPIELSLEATEAWATVAVRDHGPGLPPGDPTAVFERFWRDSASRGRDDGGAGLGLAIVAALVNAHGGRVDAENPAPGGALFTVHLPLHPPST